MNIKSKLSILKNNIYINDNLIETFGDSSFSSPYNSLICARNNASGYPEELCKSRIYYVKIWDDTTLIRNYIPCYRKLDNVIGMYDIVNNVFYTNQGTGEFIAGGDV